MQRKQNGVSVSPWARETKEREETTKSKPRACAQGEQNRAAMDHSLLEKKYKSLELYES